MTDKYCEGGRVGSLVHGCDFNPLVVLVVLNNAETVYPEISFRKLADKGRCVLDGSW